MSSFKQTPLTCNGHTRPVVHLSFSAITPSGYYLISACKGNLAALFLIYFIINKTIVHVSQDGKPMLRQGETGDWIGTFDGHKGAVWGVALNKQATKAATGAADFSAKVWDALSGTELFTLSHSHIVRSVDFSQNDQFLLTGSNEKLLKIYDLEKHDSRKII